MNDRIIKGFESVSIETLAEYSYGKKVIMSSNGRQREGSITQSPFFRIAHINTDPEWPQELTDGSWWIKIDNSERSLLDYNVIPNQYNDNSMVIVK